MLLGPACSGYILIWSKAIDLASYATYLRPGPLSQPYAFRLAQAVRRCKSSTRTHRRIDRVLKGCRSREAQAETISLWYEGIGFSRGTLGLRRSMSLKTSFVLAVHSTLTLGIETRKHQLVLSTLALQQQHIINQSFTTMSSAATCRKVGGRRQRKSGRWGRGAYDTTPMPSGATPIREVVTSIPDLEKALKSESTSTIAHNYIVPSTPAYDPAQSITIKYDYLGNAFRKNPTREGPHSMELIENTFALISQLHPNWTGRSQAEQRFYTSLSEIFGKSVVPRASARWTETRSAIGHKRDQTFGYLYIVDNDTGALTRVGTCGFPESPEKASAQWWENEHAKEKTGHIAGTSEDQGPTSETDSEATLTMESSGTVLA